jgi:hypothetical protein
VDAIKQQLPSQNTVSLAWDGWKSTNTLATMSVIAYYMNRNWELCEVQLDLKEIDHLFISYFER